MQKTYIKYTYSECKDYLVDGIYCGFYNDEHAIIRIKNKEPILVQFIDNSRIYEPKGITLSNVEILIAL